MPAYAKRHSWNNIGLYADLEQDFTKQLLVVFTLRFEDYSDFTAAPARGLELTIDAYSINIKNRIVLTNNFTGGTDSDKHSHGWNVSFGRFIYGRRVEQ